MPKPLKSLQVSNIRTDRCFNPFNLSPHPKIQNYKSLRKVREKHLLALNVAITKDSLQQRICNACRLNLSKLSHHNENNDESLKNLEVCLFSYVQNNPYSKKKVRDFFC